MDGAFMAGNTQIREIRFDVADPTVRGFPWSSLEMVMDNVTGEQLEAIRKAVNKSIPWWTFSNRLDVTKKMESGHIGRQMRWVYDFNPLMGVNNCDVVAELGMGQYGQYSVNLSIQLDPKKAYGFLDEVMARLHPNLSQFAQDTYRWMGTRPL
jgi:hypothetical protein